MVRQRFTTNRPHQQQRRRLRTSSSSSHNNGPSSTLGIPLSNTVVKFLLYLCTLFFLVILITSHQNLPSPSSSTLGRRTRRLPSRLRDSLFLSRHPSSDNNYNDFYYTYKSFLSSAFKRRSKSSTPRIAIVLPFIGKGPESIPPYLGLFCGAAGGAAQLIDFLIFHPGVLQTFAERTTVCPPNVKFINLQSMEHLAANYLLRVMDQIPPEEIRGEHNNKDLMARILTRHLMAYPYALVEYKPTFGHVFAEYLEEYSHWGYSDLDIVFGDLGRWITAEELNEFDIVTYGFGDQNRVYLRGQFTFHKNTPKINQLWRKCDYLSRLDQRFGNVLAGKQKLKFESAEGCYSAAILERQDIRVKYAVKALTDTQESDSVYSHGLYIARQKHSRTTSFLPNVVNKVAAQHHHRGLDDYHKTKNIVIYKAKSQQEGKVLLQSSTHWFERDSVYSDTTKPLQWEVGRKEVIDLADPDSKANCMYWAQKKYQSRLCVTTDVTENDTVFWINGRLFKQRYENAKLDTNVATAPFFHFQEWKRYYREGQLAAFRPDSEATTFVLTKEGAIPVYPKQAEGVGPPLWLLPQIKSPLGKAVLHWKAGNAELDRKLLPPRSYCLSSRPRTFPPVPPAPQCVSQISWWDEERVHILSMAPAWQTDLDVKLDVTLVLTLQVPVHQANEATALNGLLDIVVANLNRWQGQPCVLIMHVAVEDESQQDDVILLMEDRLTEKSAAGAANNNNNKFDANENPGIDESPIALEFDTGSCLIGVIFANLAATVDMEKKQVPPDTYHVSRKALLNMAMDAVPTRWWISGVELERGMMLSMDAAFFAHRAALSYQSVPGTVFWLPQFALDVEDDFDEGFTLSNLLEYRHKELVKEPIDFEAGQCEASSGDKMKPERVFGPVTSLWWELTKNVLQEKSSYMEDEEMTQKRAKIQHELQLRLVELLTSEKHYDLFAMDESPILLTDNQGPKLGMATNEIAREVEEFGGKLCYNALRIAQLSTLGYSLNILPSAFAASTGTSRSAAYWTGVPDDRHGLEDETTVGGSRCDGCFMFDEDHESILEGIAKDERKRPAKAAVLWEEPEPTTNFNQ
ncbi:expressed unknown protein [Seminavis robusta]|uniref:Uncharacterized protein n=1 Tax=Seminavis robusta TaxID=568900 RepID=A0A9N8HDD1_9STRA|nr:expressed unknown protein [Seminavis robusta]|eukprot:Sro421_g139590.1 n/a (1084) ;mRNA; f:52139-55502